MSAIQMSGLRTDIGVRLGSNTLDVEVSDADLTTCITDALRFLNRERPPLAWGTITGVSGASGRYEINQPGIYGITDVDWATGTSCTPCDVFDPYRPGMGTFNYGNGDTIGERVQDLTYRAQRADVAGRSTEWDTRWVRQQDGSQKLYLMLSNIPSGASVMYEYAWHLTADDNSATGVGRIPPNDLDWVLKYAIARAKQILGRVLSKYGGGINMPDGGTEQLDGDALKQRGEQEQADLEAVIRERRRVLLPRIA